MILCEIKAAYSNYPVCLCDTVTELTFCTLFNGVSTPLFVIVQNMTAAVGATVGNPVNVCTRKVVNRYVRYRVSRTERPSARRPATNGYRDSATARTEYMDSVDGLEDRLDGILSSSHDVHRRTATPLGSASTNGHHDLDDGVSLELYRAIVALTDEFEQRYEEVD